MGVAGSAWEEGSGPDDQGLPSKALRMSSSSSNLEAAQAGRPLLLGV